MSSTDFSDRGRQVTWAAGVGYGFGHWGTYLDQFIAFHAVAAMAVPRLCQTHTGDSDILHTIEIPANSSSSLHQAGSGGQGQGIAAQAQETLGNAAQSVKDTLGLGERA